MQTIKFRLEQAPGVDFDGAPCTRAWVTGTIHGRQIGHSEAPVSYFDLLAYRGLSCEFSLLTCSCGVPGCAGYHDDAYQVWGEKYVDWSVNRHEYGPHFPNLDAHPVRLDHLHMRLSTAALQAALDDLVRQVQVALRGGPVHLAPGFDDDPLHTIEEFEEAIAKTRAWLLEQRERHEARRSTSEKQTRAEPLVQGSTLPAKKPALRCLPGVNEL